MSFTKDVHDHGLPVLHNVDYDHCGAQIDPHCPLAAVLEVVEAGLVQLDGLK